MSLEVKAKQILKNFDETSSKDILEILNQIQFKFHSQITQNYLKEKLVAISEASDESQKKQLCKNLIPYFDWYLQGL